MSFVFKDILLIYFLDTNIWIYLITSLSPEYPFAPKNYIHRIELSMFPEMHKNAHKSKNEWMHSLITKSIYDFLSHKLLWLLYLT